jgi:hypothetical protein
MLTWFYYLSFFKKNSNEANKTFKLKIKYLPIRKKIFTSVKAPMAHKTRSKEQFAYQYYKFLIMFKADATNANPINSPDSGLLFVFLTKKNFQIFETNLLFLKYFKCSVTICVSSFINYYKNLK